MLGTQRVWGAWPVIVFDRSPEWTAFYRPHDNYHELVFVNEGIGVVHYWYCHEASFRGFPPQRHPAGQWKREDPVGREPRPFVYYGDDAGS